MDFSWFEMDLFKELISYHLYNLQKMILVTA